MTSETFAASTQYNDLLGSSAADRADSGDATQWLRQHGHLQPGELILGIEAYISPSVIPQSSEVSVSATFLIVSADNFEQAAEAVRQASPASVRKVTLEMSPKDFFSLFKRFSITLSNNGLLEGREISAD